MDVVEIADPALLDRSREAIRQLRSRLAYVRTPEGAADLSRQSAILANAADEDEIMDFIEAVTDLDGE